MNRQGNRLLFAICMLAMMGPAEAVANSFESGKTALGEHI